MANSPKVLALKRRSDYLFLQKNGKKFHLNHWLLVNYHPNKLGYWRCGWTVSRFVGTAVVRNRLKRWCRDCLRKIQLEEEKTFDVNLVFKRQPAGFYRELKRKEFDEALGKAFSRLQNIHRSRGQAEP